MLAWCRIKIATFSLPVLEINEFYLSAEVGDWYERESKPFNEIKLVEV